MNETTSKIITNISQKVYSIQSHQCYNSILHMENYLRLLVKQCIIHITIKRHINITNAKKYTNTGGVHCIVTKFQELARELLSHIISKLRTSNSPKRFRLQLLVGGSKEPAHVPLTGGTVGYSPSISAQRLAY